MSVPIEDCFAGGSRFAAGFSSPSFVPTRLPLCRASGIVGAKLAGDELNSLLAMSVCIALNGS